MSSAASNFRNHRHQQLWPRGLSLSSIPPKFHYLSLLSPTQCVSILPAVEFALSLEKLANEKLLLLHSVAEKNKDVLLIDFVETEFLAEQVRLDIFLYLASVGKVLHGHLRHNLWCSAFTFVGGSLQENI
ncbi:ferritin, chloroplastic-like isoform X1 [Pyrus x bretschneideri]|uniref:ferritin, chloroplastic-like isoform X1 n=1 Tax=Pyrus x bretschneideri TaxID=225117 RepID=UPI00202F861A|nr:ferritin, chloroplastic-like isoform X1 [Pyrus x bretschneideri]